MTENDANGFFSTDTTPKDNNPTDLDTKAMPLGSTHGWPLEDLTGEVQDYMLRESMNWLPWLDEHQIKTPLQIKNMTEDLDSQLLSQTLQLDGLFDHTNFDMNQLNEMASSLFYNEMIYDHSPVNTPLPTPTGIPDQQLQHHAFMEAPVLTEPPSFITQYPDQDEKRPDEPAVVMRDDLDSTDDDDSEEDDSDDEGSVMTSTYMYLPKRQVEESLLDKITHQLSPHKLAGILSIVSTDDDDDGKQDGEVEIDLSCLAREQLVRVMLYVDACLVEQQGGPQVKLAKYLLKGSKQTGEQRKSNDSVGPISMAALTKKSRSRKTSLEQLEPRRRTRKKQLETRPKRRAAAALHKRRMLEETSLVHSDQEDMDVNLGDDMEQQVMITFGEEQMDLRVVDNQTIVHQPSCQPMDQNTLDNSSIAPCMEEDDDDDEEIDIM
ncbi:hypothetical protein BC941DRAFT_433122 [Chlamydoabsidia padenii]|nr:hypothetical protein BC941DRAFT_433122 [Chlamydoabsidia padenii]